VQERVDANAVPACPPGMEVRERPEAMAKGKKAPPPVTPAPAPEPEPTGPPPPPSDRDGDGIPDDVDKCPDQPETINGYLDDDGCPDEVPAALKQFSGSIQGVNFKSAEAIILPSSLKILDAAAKALADFPDIKVEVQGHTDDVPPGAHGKYKTNLELSQARADAVKAYLETKGVDDARLTAKGYGDTIPLVQPKGLKGGALNNARTKNRRVEFKLLK
jgi:outer membrane protein OmpA-like peptidoglycan-associated protein